jgi:hypothetical protein
VLDLPVRLSRKHALALAPYPGVVQVKRDEPLRGLAVFGAVAAGAGATMYAHRSFTSINRSYENYRDLYRAAITEEAALHYGDLAQQRRGDAVSAMNVRNALMGATAALYVVQIFDALRRPAPGFASAVDPDYLIAPVYGPASRGAVARIRL